MVVACAVAFMASLCVWLTCVIVWTDGWSNPAAVQCQCKGPCGGYKDSGGAGSSCEPSHGGLVGSVIWAW